MPKVTVSYVEFSPEEMAMDCPPDTSDPRYFPTIGPNDASWKKFITFRNGFAKLDGDLRKAFKNDRAVNEALRYFLRKQSAEAATVLKRRKSA